MKEEDEEIAGQRALADRVLGLPMRPVLKAGLKGEIADQIERTIATLKQGADDEVRVDLERLQGLIGQWRACDRDEEEA